MTYTRWLWTLVFVIALAVVSAEVRADPAAGRDRSLLAGERAAAAVPSACDGLSSEAARRVAKAKRHDGQHRLAATCFRVAGKPVRADHALMRASAESMARATEEAAKTVESAKEQARRLREAFR